MNSITRMGTIPDDGTTAVIASNGAGLENAVGQDIATLVDSTKPLLENRLPLETRSWLERVFPDPITKARVKGRAKIEEGEMAFQLRFHTIYRETEARVLAALMSHMLREGKTGLQSRTASFVMDREKELMKRVEGIIAEHQDNVQSAVDRAKKMELEDLRDMELDRIKRSYARLVNDVTVMLDQFSQIVAETIPATREQ